MAEILNLDALVGETVTIQKHGKRYALRDDMPMELMVRVFGLQTAGERLRDERDPEAQMRAFEAVRAEVASILLALLRFSLSPAEAEELAGSLTFDEQNQVIQLFFARRSNASRRPPNASADGATVTRDALASQTGATRAATAPMGERLSRGQKKRARRRQDGRERFSGQPDEGLIR